MRTQLEATVERGGLKLDTPLAFPDRTRVQVTVEALEQRLTRALLEWRRFMQQMREHPIYAGVRFTREELHDRD